MEDRFNVVNDLEHTETSIYGIFDGHGGEVVHVLLWTDIFTHLFRFQYIYFCSKILFQFAADFAEKTLFKTIMVRLLKSALQGEKDNFTSLLNDEILNVDNQLLQVERATNEVSGMSIFCSLELKNIATCFIVISLKKIHFDCN